MKEIKAAMVKPINAGAKRPGGRRYCRGSVTAKTTNAKIGVPRNSARNAVGSETGSFSRRWASSE